VKLIRNKWQYFHFTTQKWIFVKFHFKCRSTSIILIFDLRPVLRITGDIALVVKYRVIASSVFAEAMIFAEEAMIFQGFSPVF